MLSVQLGTGRKRLSVRVRGVVQGVGFRPFVFRLAMEGGLSGFIGNDTDGVIIEVEGASDEIAAFLARLRSEPPPMARIDSVDVEELSIRGESGFTIVSSQVLGRVWVRQRTERLPAYRRRSLP